MKAAETNFIKLRGVDSLVNLFTLSPRSVSTSVKKKAINLLNYFFRLHFSHKQSALHIIPVIVSLLSQEDIDLVENALSALVTLCTSPSSSSAGLSSPSSSSSSSSPSSKHQKKKKNSKKLKHKHHQTTDQKKVQQENKEYLEAKNTASLVNDICLQKEINLKLVIEGLMKTISDRHDDELLGVVNIVENVKKLVSLVFGEEENKNYLSLYTRIEKCILHDQQESERELKKIKTNVNGYDVVQTHSNTDTPMIPSSTTSSSSSSSSSSSVSQTNSKR